MLAAESVFQGPLIEIDDYLTYDRASFHESQMSLLMQTDERMQQFIMVDVLDQSLYPDKFTLPNSQKLFVGGLSDLTTECK